MKRSEILRTNRDAWDRYVQEKSRWTKPASSRTVASARAGRWRIVLTPSKAVPKDWFPPLKGARVLCLASGGGQQGPVLAAAGAKVTVLDCSPLQLAQDKAVAGRCQLDLSLVQGDMADLGQFKDCSFDLIVHPCSNCFAPRVRPVWRECYRVLRPGGALLAGFMKPVTFLFDPLLAKKHILRLRFKMPYSSLKLTSGQRRKYLDPNAPLEFAHSLDEQIGGQLDAGFQIVGFYEDDFGGQAPLDRYMPSCIATKAIKFRGGA